MAITRETKNSPEVWSRVVAVNLSGPFWMARAVVGRLMDQGWAE